MSSVDFPLGEPDVDIPGMVSEIESISNGAGEVVQPLVNALDAEMESLVNASTELTSVLINGASEDLTDIANGLSDLTGILNGSLAMEMEQITIPASEFPALPQPEPTEPPGVPTLPEWIRDSGFTLKQLLWYNWRLFTACVRGNRWVRQPNPEGQCIDFANRAHEIERLVGLPEITPVVPSGPPFSTSIQIPSDDQIKLFLNGRQIEIDAGVIHYVDGG